MEYWKIVMWGVVIIIGEVIKWVAAARVAMLFKALFER